MAGRGSLSKVPGGRRFSPSPLAPANPFSCADPALTAPPHAPPRGPFFPGRSQGSPPSGVTPAGPPNLVSTTGSGKGAWLHPLASCHLLAPRSKGGQAQALRGLRQSESLLAVGNCPEPPRPVPSAPPPSVQPVGPLTVHSPHLPLPAATLGALGGAGVTPLAGGVPEAVWGRPRPT